MLFIYHVYIAGILGYIPVCVVILPLIAGVLGGIPFVLFVIKEQKFGAVTLMGLIIGSFNLPCRSDMDVNFVWSCIWFILVT